MVLNLISSFWIMMIICQSQKMKKSVDCHYVLKMRMVNQ